ncbi:hypothetical protein PNK_p0065 (plasmid) [Candidatus Protochlamydia naegleriophila]|uniref:Uncharacterized protein n=1 Tax=Candidatus Protochlamydia naegleriophila TaxID=389348 RepID=A0A0U5JFY7_9BACT|nr:SEL1-like repeat protein [Candidatus Protochlamydia naegleriophila]CUI18119.1 hypothetical protein PNK_p0065 [Candidatus Protochlamydia naegleriophila]
MSITIQDQKNDESRELVIYQPHLNFYLLPILKIPIGDLSCWRKIADKGSTEFQLKVACFYEEVGDFSFALFYYGLAAPMVRHNKNHIVIRGFIERLMDRSLEETINHLKYAKTQNNPLAYYVLAQCYLRGVGVQKSLTKALHHYQQAAHFGYPCDLKVIAESLLKLRIKKFVLTRFLKALLVQHEKERAWQLNQLAELFEDGSLGNHPEAALYYHKLAASLGMKLSVIRLGDIYLQGLLGVGKNENLGIHYYLLGRHLGPVNSIAGQYEKSDPEKAFKYYQKAFEVEKQTDCCSSLIKLGYCYRHGIGVEKSLEKAIDCYRLAVDHGYGSASYELGECFEEQNNLDQAVKCYEKGVELNRNGHSAYRLAELFEQGKGVSKSLDKAFEYYNLAASHGIENAYAQVARCYLNGIGTEQSHKNAFEAFKKQDNYYEVALCYLKGRGVSQSLAKAQIYFLQWVKNRPSLSFSNDLVGLLKKEYIHQFRIDFSSCVSCSVGQQFAYIARQISVHLNDTPLKLRQITWDAERICLEIADEFEELQADQYYRLGVHYAKESMWDRAFEYFKKAADQGVISAQYHLGRYFQSGTGCLRSHEQAIHYFKLASDQGCPNSLYELGTYYDKGFGGIDRSYAYAFEYFKIAADSGIGRALCALGLYYELGRYVERSLEHAFDYFKLAADLGYDEGMYHVGRFYRLGRVCSDSIYSLEEAIGYFDSAIKSILSCPSGSWIASKPWLKVSFLKNQISLCKKLLLKQKEIDQSCSVLPSHSVIFPEAKKLDICLYLKDRNLTTLRKVLRRSKHSRLILEGHHLSGEELNVVKEGMIENPRLTFVCPEEEAENLYLVFEEGGYSREDLKSLPVVDGLIGILFIGVNHHIIISEQVKAASYFYFDLQDYKKAFLHFHVAALMGDATSQYFLGRCYGDGQGVEKSAEKSFHYFKLAADQGDLSSCYNLGIAYLQGKGTKRDIQQAMLYLKFAADQGHVFSATQLASIYEDDLYIKHSYDESFKYYCLAARAGDLDSLFQVGRYYKWGRMIPKDLHKALSCFRELVQRGYRPNTVQIYIQECEKELAQSIYQISKDKDPRDGFFKD